MKTAIWFVVIVLVLGFFMFPKDALKVNDLVTVTGDLSDFNQVNRYGFAKTTCTPLPGEQFTITALVTINGDPGLELSSTSRMCTGAVYQHQAKKVTSE